MNVDKRVITKYLLIPIIFFIPIYLLLHFFYPNPAPGEKVLYSGPTAIDLAEVEQKGTIGVKEDIEARTAYETRMLIDPQLGSIPPDIRKKEILFSRTLPVRGVSRRNARRSTTYEITATDWMSNGPFSIGGRTRALALDITDENTILAGGTSGGMWRSQDSGTSWEKVTAPQALHSVTCLAQDTRTGKENTWYYGTGELTGNSARGGGSAIFRGDGIFKSNNGGLSWTLLPSTAAGEPESFTNPFQFIWNIVTNEQNNVEDEVLVATFGGIQRSTDGGNSWNYVIGEGTNKGSLFSDIALSKEGIFYATMSESSGTAGGSSQFRGIYRSANGQNWTNIIPGNFPQNFDRTVIGISDSNPNVVYFLASSDPNDLWKYTYLSGDGSGNGGRWVNLTDNIPMFGGSVGDFDSQRSYNMVIKVHPENEDIVFVGGTNLYRSTDGFATTQNTSWVGGYSTLNDITDYVGHHPDQHHLVFLPSDPDVAVSAHDGGLSRSNDVLAQQVSWTSLNNGYITSQFYALAMSESVEDNIIVGGMQDNGSHLTSSGQSNGEWKRLLGGDGGYAAVGHDGTNVYVSSQNGRIIRYFKKGDEFISVARIDPSMAGQVVGQELLFITPFILDPHNNSKMYVAGGDRIWRNNNVTQIPGSTDSTAINWFDIPATKIGGGQITSLAISRTPRNIMYYGTTLGSLFKVTNVDSYQPEVEALTPNSTIKGGYVSCIDIDPGNADNILIVFSNYNVQSIYQSTNGGETFVPVGGNLEEKSDGTGAGPSVRWARIIPKVNNQYLYLAGTSTGLYSTENLDGENTIWAQEGPDVIGNVVVPMIQYRQADGKVSIATHGNGIYTKTFDNVQPFPNETIGDEFSLSQNFPNPFSDFTTIRFNLPQQSVARIKIFNRQGKKIRVLLLATQFEGENEVVWDGKDGNGVNVSNGIYFYSLDYGVTSFIEEGLTKKIILIR